MEENEERKERLNMLIQEAESRVDCVCQEERLGTRTPGFPRFLGAQREICRRRKDGRRPVCDHRYASGRIGNIDIAYSFHKGKVCDQGERNTDHDGRVERVDDDM